MSGAEEAVPPMSAEPTAAELTALGQRQLEAGDHAEAAGTFSLALNKAPNDDDLPALIQVAMQKAMLSGSGKVAGVGSDIPPELSERVNEFLLSVGIGGSEEDARVFDAEPMLRFAINEGLSNAAAEQIYARWVERQMEGAIESFEVVQSHIKDTACPLKVTVRVVSSGLELFSREAGGLVETISYSSVSRYKKLVRAGSPAPPHLNPGFMWLQAWVGRAGGRGCARDGPDLDPREREDHQARVP
jgi:hypothetical protein